MKIAKIVSLVCTFAMATIIMYAFIAGDFNSEGSKLLSMPWGIVSLVDLYSGFTLFSAWIIYREKTWGVKIFWVILMMTLGFFTGGLYAFIALQKSGGSWKRFWMGQHAK